MKLTLNTFFILPKLYDVDIKINIPIINKKQLLINELMKLDLRDILEVHIQLINLKNSSVNLLEEDLDYTKTNICSDLVKYLLEIKPLEIISYNET